MKLKNISIFIFIISILLIACEKETYDDKNFSPYDLSFKVDSIYQANSDGFLIVSSNSSSSDFTTTIISDKNSNPTTVIAKSCGWGETITVPIIKNNFWKVTHNDEPYDEFSIVWTANE